MKAGLLGEAVGGSNCQEQTPGLKQILSAKPLLPLSSRIVCSSSLEGAS